MLFSHQTTHIFTARTRSLGQGNIFSTYLSTGGGAGPMFLPEVSVQGVYERKGGCLCERGQRPLAGHWSRRFASQWNAFSLLFNFSQTTVFTEWNVRQRRRRIRSSTWRYSGKSRQTRWRETLAPPSLTPQSTVSEPSTLLNSSDYGK